MSYKIIGQCSICGGDVVIPLCWYSTYPPKPYCLSCGAVKRNDLPVIPMEPSRTQYNYINNKFYKKYRYKPQIYKITDYLNLRKYM